MENIFIEFLPPWIETGLQPAFYDKESGTVLQQTARMYAKINQLVASVNNQNTAINEYIDKFNELHDYVYDYFDNLDVQREINNKLDKMLRDGSLEELISTYVDTYADTYVNPKIDNQNNRISAIEDRVNSLGNFAPIPVGNINQMTDQSKVYVLTTDGNWYYYNNLNSEWTVGGTYQASALGLGSVDFDNLTNNLSKSIYTFSYDAKNLGSNLQNDSIGSFNYSQVIFLKAGTIITLSKDFVSNYKWCLSRLSDDGYRVTSSNYFDYVTDTTYTVPSDMLCAFKWKPIDNDWNTETYTVNRKHLLDNNDITSILFFYPKTHENTLIDLDYNLICGSFIDTGYIGGNFFEQYNRFGSSVPYISKFDIIVDIKNSNYNFGVIFWSDNTDARTLVRDSGWISNRYIIPANTYFTIVCRKRDNTQIANWDVDDPRHLLSLTSYGTLDYIRSYVDSYASGVSTYNYEGENINLQFKHGYDKTDLYNTRLITSSSQGIDIYNNQYLVQLYNGGTIQLINYATGVEISNITGVDFKHGDTCQFSNTFYDPSDLLPLLYVTSDTTPSIVYVVRIQDTTTASIVKSYLLDSGAGYYAGHCFDFDNNLIYCFGYKQNEFHTNTGGTNNTIITVYDMNNVQQVSETEFKPEIIDRYEKPFIYCVQGQKFLNGKCYLVSSYNSTEQETRIYVYDPTNKLFTAVFSDMPSDISNHETEDIAFVKGSNKYEMVVATRAKYMKLVFSE